MAITFQELIDAEESFKVYLVRLRPYRKYDTFTLHSGAVYKKTISETVVHARFDLTQLTSGSDEASLAEGEFFYKESTEELFIRCPGGVNPSTGSVYGYHYYLFSNYGYNQDGHWEERIDQNGLPSLSRGRNGTLERITVSTGELRLLNGGGYFKNLWNDYFWDQILIEVFLTGFIYTPNESLEDWLPWDLRKTILRGLARKKSYNDIEVAFSVFDFIDLIDIPFPLSTYDSATFANLDPSAEGQPIHRGYGVLKGVPCALIDTTGNGTYKCDDQAITSFDAIYDEDQTTLSTSSTDTANAKFTLSTATTKRVFVDYTKNTGSGSPYNYAGSIKLEILQNALGVATTDIDTASYAALDTDRPYVLGVSISSRISIADVFNRINQSALSEDNTDRNGKITTKKIVKPSASDSNQQIYDDDLNVIGDPDFSNPENVYSSIAIGYGRNQSLENESQYKYVVGSGAGADFETLRTLTIETALTSKSDATTVAALYKPFIDAPETVVTLTTQLKPFNQHIGETFTYARPSEKGPSSLTNYWKILEIRENFNSGQTQITGVQ